MFLAYSTKLFEMPSHLIIRKLHFSLTIQASLLVFTRMTQCVSTVFAVATCLDVWMFVCHMPVLSEQLDLS